MSEPVPVNLPLVSIGIPTYNRAGHYLRNALESALAQDYKNIEIIVSDNASTDATSELVNSFACERLRYVRHKENIGANGNFNYCLNQASGDYFLLLHDDDSIDSDFVSSCINVLDGKFDVGLVRSGTRLVDAHSKVLKENTNRARDGSFVEFVEDWCNGNSSLYLCSTLFNTEQLKLAGGFHSPHGLFQDVVADMELAAKHGHRNVSAVKASFRRHEDNRGTSVRATHWQTDSLFLLDRVLVLAGNEAGHIRKKLQLMLCRKNYLLIQKVGSFITRWIGYFQVYTRFGYALSPIRFIRQREFGRSKSDALIL